MALATGHQPRETRGPIETNLGGRLDVLETQATSRAKRAALLKPSQGSSYWVVPLAATSRAKRAALLKLPATLELRVHFFSCHQPRETRGPIETPRCRELGQPEAARATSRAKRAALLKLVEGHVVDRATGRMPPAARNARPY